MKALKTFFIKYKIWLLKIVAPLGPWAVFAIAFLDAAAFGVPMDPIVAVYAYQMPRIAVVLAVLAALGSALGSTVPYMIGYKGGEAMVVKSVGRERFAKVHSFIEKYGVMALFIPCLLPPGFPMKLFILSAGVAEMKYSKFLLTIFAGRLLRFSALAALTIYYGPEAMMLLGDLFMHHRTALLATLGLLALGGLAWWLLRRKRSGKTSSAIAEAAPVADNE